MTVLRAAAVIPGELRPEDFKALLFDAAEAIEKLRTDKAAQVVTAARSAETIESLRETVAEYRRAKQLEG
ncbi:hypothetical protein ACFSCV_07185 [Methylopila henanensis]|uniref:Uncharacterized protein n=1 Tax=Methylopila henanensis TaxID=873516 RepID=A0ABW4K3N5_9HYPH